MPQIAVLAAYQQSGEKARTFVPKEVADELMRRLAAERISAKKIRMFPDDSRFVVLKGKHPEDRNYVPAHYPPIEIETCKYQPPKNSVQPSLCAARERWDWNHDPLPEWVRPVEMVVAL